jgi:hypothetical protein
MKPLLRKLDPPPPILLLLRSDRSYLWFLHNVHPAFKCPETDACVQSSALDRTSIAVKNLDSYAAMWWKPYSSGSPYFLNKNVLIVFTHSRTSCVTDWALVQRDLVPVTAWGHFITQQFRKYFFIIHSFATDLYIHLQHVRVWLSKWKWLQGNSALYYVVAYFEQRNK